MNEKKYILSLADVCSNQYLNFLIITWVSRGADHSGDPPFLLMNFNMCYITIVGCWTPPPPPPPHSHRICSFPITWFPYLGKDSYMYIPISGICYHWQLQKTPPFPGFLGKSSRDYAKITPFPRKWEHACGTLSMYSSGGGVVKSTWII